jgi:SAM-dependent methyltransferase
MNDAALTAFGAAYARHRQAEGRDYSGDDLAMLPYVRSGPLARQWAVRARTFEAFMRNVLRPERRRLDRRLTLLDLGAGNGWLSHRVASDGDDAIALDIRTDAIDGLAAAETLAHRVVGQMRCVTGSFQSIPLPNDQADIAVFNASLHYATDLNVALAEAARVVRGNGCLAIMDSPFYSSGPDGCAMVAEKHAQAASRYGDAAGVLLGPPFIEFLTRARLANASREFGLHWQRRRVSYPLWYELRPLIARLTGRRQPSRFDLWVARLP